MHLLLNESDRLPHPTISDTDLVAVSTHLSSERMIEGYGKGLFPWNNSDNELIMWWSPQIRGIFGTNDFHTSRSFARFLRQSTLTTSFDRAFSSVVAGCAARSTTWITPNLKACFLDLYQRGYGHSVEVWNQGELVGGIFGVAIGRIFMGESMFSLVPNASKVALKCLLDHLKLWRFQLLDAQLPNPHLDSLGCRSITRAEYLEQLAINQQSTQCVQGRWQVNDVIYPWRDSVN